MEDPSRPLTKARVQRAASLLPTAVLTLRIRNDPAELIGLEADVQLFVAQHRLTGEDESTLYLLLEELILNVISYAYDDDDTHEIVVRMAMAGRDLHVEIEDDGRPFDPTVAPPPDLAAPLQQRRAGGLGIHLVRSLVDDVTYRRDAGKNIVTLVKKLLP